ncbi:MAG: DUF3552 domain-containing protein, partial [Lentisphaeria bacterium]|nr:DUF3552 domain-containing protein [Lentisphaeria bacterium]
MMQIIIVAVALLAGLIAGMIVHYFVVRAAGSKSVAAANQMKNDAEREAERILREARVTAKSDVLKIKEDFENEMKERRREIQASERRLAQKEENFDRKADSLDAKFRNMENKEHEIDQIKERLAGKEEELKKNISRQIDELQRISGLSRETATAMLLEKLKG